MIAFRCVHHQVSVGVCEVFLRWTNGIFESKKETVTVLETEKRGGVVAISDEVTWRVYLSYSSHSQHNIKWKV